MRSGEAEIGESHGDVLECCSRGLPRSHSETIKRYALWYLIEGVLLVVAGVLAVIYPVITSAAVVILLGWLLIISGSLQGLSLIGARHVLHFWLQSIYRDPRCRDGRLLRWILPSSIDLPFATPAAAR